VDVPVIADADTGYGGILNVHRTVQQYERAGVAAIHIEDQDVPKRCGHLDDKEVIGTEEMALKIRAAVEARTDDDFVIIVRTDALAVTGMDDTLRRCEEYVKAGADALFIEALRTEEDIDLVTRAFDVPLLYNFVEKGKSPLIPTPELERLGFKIVIFPGSIMFTVCRLVSEILGEIKDKGTTERLLDNMASPAEFFETLGLSEMLALDARFAAVAQTAS
jgi:2-methylisocitrate lyase-like PEP mutase family enzyme